MLLITQRNRLWMAAAFGFAAMALYGVVGAATEELSPTVLPFWAIDRGTPLIPWTFWVYATIYLIYAAACLLLDDLRALRAFLTSYAIANVLSSVVFLAFPTTFPRDLFPVGVSQLSEPVSSQALAWFRTVDRPTNCFPSMHVGCATLSALAFRRRQPRLFIVFAVWASAISVATMTTKQHYFIDVIGGATLGVASYWIAERVQAGGRDSKPLESSL